MPRCPPIAQPRTTWHIVGESHSEDITQGVSHALMLARPVASLARLFGTRIARFELRIALAIGLRFARLLRFSWLAPGPPSRRVFGCFAGMARLFHAFDFQRWVPPAGSPVFATRAPRAPDHAAAEGKDRRLRINATPAAPFRGQWVPGKVSRCPEAYGGRAQCDWAPSRIVGRRFACNAS
jgi:hypothetical protein